MCWLIECEPGELGGMGNEDSPIDILIIEGEPGELERNKSPLWNLWCNEWARKTVRHIRWLEGHAIKKWHAGLKKWGNKAFLFIKPILKQARLKEWRNNELILPETYLETGSLERMMKRRTHLAQKPIFKMQPCHAAHRADLENWRPCPNIHVSKSQFNAQTRDACSMHSGSQRWKDH